MIALHNAQLCAPEIHRPLLRVPELLVCPGERLVVTGPSGSGKSLLLSLITGHWAQELDFTGYRHVSADRIGYIPQRGQDALNPLLPLGTQLRKATGEAIERIQTTLDLVGLDDPRLLSRRPAELSGGQAQRAAIALATLCDAPIIVADEPTSALDQTTRDHVLELLNHVITEDQALVLVTHDPHVAQKLASNHVVLNSGVLTHEHSTVQSVVPA